MQNRPVLKTGEDYNGEEATTLHLGGKVYFACEMNPNAWAALIRVSLGGKP